MDSLAVDSCTWLKQGILGELEAIKIYWCKSKYVLFPTILVELYIGDPSAGEWLKKLLPSAALTESEVNRYELRWKGLQGILLNEERKLQNDNVTICDIYVFMYMQRK